MPRKQIPKIYFANLDMGKTEITIKQYKYKDESTVDFSDVDDFCGTDNEKVIFINNLNVVQAFLPGGEVSKTYKVSKYDGKTIEPTTYTYKHTRFRSFSLMKPESMKNKELCNLFNTSSVVDAMEQYVDMCGGPLKISATVSSQCKKMFYEDIKESLKTDRYAKRRYFNSIDLYKLCYAGCKSGEISSVDNVKVYENVECFDISSAYSSVMVNDDKFPIGRVKVTNDKNLIVKRFNNKEWVKVVFQGKLEGYDFYYDERVDMTAFEYYDILSEILTNKNIFDLCDDSTTYLYCDNTGYLNDSLRDKVVEVYEQKSSMQKSDPKRILVKQQLEAVYGKGIQWYDFKDDAELIKHFKGKGENYLQPQMANHCSAAIRYQLTKIVTAFDDEMVYWDTDGVKVKNSDFVIEYFNNLNKVIVEKNKLAGYNTRIGTWTHEGSCKKIVLIRPKMYAYVEKEQGLVMKFAGMDDEGKCLCLSKTRELGKDIFEAWEVYSFPMYTYHWVIQNGKIYKKWSGCLLS